MEEQQVTIDGHTIPLEDPFMVIATQNPVESQQGTFPLPVAQMDRFFLKLGMSYPTFEEEKLMMKIHRNEGKVEPIETVLNENDINEMKEAANKVTFSDDVEAYLLELVRKTRSHMDIELGVSPRGTLALMKAAQGKAFMEGRNYVVPNDIKEMAAFVLIHRIFLTTEASLTKSVEKVLEEIIMSTSVPVEAGV